MFFKILDEIGWIIKTQPVRDLADIEIGMEQEPLRFQDDPLLDHQRRCLVEGLMCKIRKRAGR